MDEINRSGGAPSRPRVLLVEDSAMNAMLVVASLQDVCEVVVVERGEDVLPAIAAERFALMLLDFHLNGLSGLDVTHALRAREAGEGGPRLPIVMLTASTDHHDRDACLRAGADGIMLKPFKVMELRGLVQRHLDAAQQPG